MINNLYIDASYVSINKYKEELCGDSVAIIKNDNSLVYVLADGLGSGVKANILSILTSKLISTMIANDLDINMCVETIASILPICSERQIAYSTFTVVKITNNNFAQIIEYDNPQLIYLNDGKYKELFRTSTKIDDKIIYYSTVNLSINDTLVFVSDGAIYAGVGQNLNFGWQRDNIVKYLLQKYNETLTAKTIATIVVDKCNELYAEMPGDDTTCCTLKVNERKSVDIVIGPPQNPKDDNLMMQLFFAKEGKHIICGGTTASIAARFLGNPIDTTIDLKKLNYEIPPISYIEGVDLVTEGIITINKTLFYLKDYLNQNEHYEEWINGDDGASLITRLLVEDATDITFFVGKAINPAHQNPGLKIDFNIKMKLIEEVTKYLELMGKNVKISYF